ncbi:hypothetical protein, partial [Novilysobacter spongiicola]|uniref:hypothetical protein n=1 Tax=Novilysobacter spongiicola TaxID=435289 RepID=UPI001F32C0E3
RTLHRCVLTVRSSRRHFVARLNSGVRPLIEFILLITLVPLTLYFGVLVAVGFFSSDLYKLVVVLVGAALLLFLLSFGHSMDPVALLLSALILSGYAAASWLAAVCIRNMNRSHAQSAAEDDASEA